MYKERVLEEKDDFFAEKSLQKLAQKNNWSFETHVSKDHSKCLYDLLPRDIKFSLQCFSNDDTRTEPWYKHFLIFKGHSGTGKTTLSLAIAKHLEFKTIFIPGYCLSDSHGNSNGAKLSKVFALATQEDQPTIIIIDNVHSLAQGRYKILENLEGSKVFVLLTTDNLKGYSDDFKRYNRDYIFKMRNPGKDVRRIMIESLMQTRVLDNQLSVEEWKEFLVKHTEGMNCFAIGHLFHWASIKAGSENQSIPPHQWVINKKHFYDAKQRFRTTFFSKLVKKLKAFSEFLQKHPKISFVITTNLLIASLLIWQFNLILSFNMVPLPVYAPSSYPLYMPFNMRY